MERAFPALLLGIACACAPPPAGTLGALLGRKENGRVFLREVPPDLAAGKAGLRPGDELLLVEGADVRPLTDQELRELLEGPPGSQVDLTVERGAEVLRVQITLTPARRHAGPK